MNRQDEILCGISKTAKGIEVAPYHSPMAARRDGYDIRILDVFDTETLKARLREDALLDNNTVGNIEDVDYVGSATEIANIVPIGEHGSFDYIVSSHNFEHLTNPIKFLVGCQQLLKSGGIVSMAVPDARSCFDYFRPITGLGEWLEAYFEDRQKPSSRQIFEFQAYHSVLLENGTEHFSFQRGPLPEKMHIKGDLVKCFNDWENSSPDDPYSDAHCTVMTPNSLRLLLEECQMIGLIKLKVESISPVNGMEFYVRLSKTSSSADTQSISEAVSNRSSLLQAAFRDQQLAVELFKPRKIVTKAKRWLRKWKIG